jgi:hypothetical protein
MSAPRVIYTWRIFPGGRFELTIRAGEATWTRSEFAHDFVTELSNACSIEKPNEVRFEFVQEDADAPA